MELGIGPVIGITVGAIAATVLVMNLIYMKQVKPLYPEGPREPGGFLQYFSIINWFKVLYYFLPYSLFLFGIIYDGLVRKIKFFPAGFVGLGAVLINHLLSLATREGGNASIDNDLCGIPGMNGWGSKIAPQNITFATAVLSYLASYITSTQSDSQYSGIAWAGVFIVWIIQTIVFNRSDCYKYKQTGWLWTSGNEMVSRIAPPLLGLFSGMFWGGLSGWLIGTYVGVGPGVDVTQQQSLLGGKGPAMAPTSGTAGAGKCSPTDSDDAFVCEAYKNGELVTSTIVE